MQINIKGDNVLGKIKKILKKNYKGNKRRVLSLTGKISCISILPALIMGLVMTIVGVTAIRQGMQEEVFASLEAIAVSIDAAYMAIDEGDYSLSDDNELFKGELNVTENENLIDSFISGNNKQVTLFYEDVRYATSLVSVETGERILGTTADPEVYKRVVGQGETIYLSDIVINNTDYYACYIPMRNSDGSIVGMYFAGQPAESVNAFVKQKVVYVLVAGIIIGLISVILILLVTRGIKHGIIAAEDAVTSIAAGVLNVPVDQKGLKRNDELGDMMRDIQKLQQGLERIVSDIKNSVDVLNQQGDELSRMAADTSVTADGVKSAVDGISQGTLSQAHDVEIASDKVSAIGNMIGSIVLSANTLDKLSLNMKNNGDEAMVIIDKLAASNNATSNAVEKIGEMVTATNESAARISEAVTLITSIADETNLLSLNASIEAARAGEQGRGFAVVAGQIQKLAEQSNASAISIAEIINELLDDSKNAVEVMTEVRKIVNKQQERFEQTKYQFSSVHDGIDRSREEAEEIKTKTNKCDKEKEDIIQIISNLASISEENAGSAQETTSSMEELNDTIGIIAGSAASLQSISAKLQTIVEIFKL